VSAEEEYQNKMAAQLEEWKAEIEQLRAKDNKAKADLKNKLCEPERINGIPLKEAFPKTLKSHPRNLSDFESKPSLRRFSQGIPEEAFP